MDDISQQLKNEILSLESYIERTEDHLLATQWTSELLDPLEQEGEGLSEADLTAALTALHQAKAKFSVNGRVGGRIDEILKKYSSMLPELPTLADGLDEDVVLSIDAGVDGDAFPEIADSLFEEEDAEPDPSLFEFGQVDAVAGSEMPAASASFAFAGLVDEDEDASIVTGDDSALLFNENEESPGVAAVFEDLADDGMAPVGGSSDDLFADSSDPTSGPAAGDSPKSSARAGGVTPQRAESENGQTANGKPPEPQEKLVDIFAHTVSLDDIQAALDVSLPQDDIVLLQQGLRAKLNDKVVASLRRSKFAEKQFTLIPRIQRFVHKGVSQPCTVLTLAKTFPAMFGKIQELGRYRGNAFVTSETPELGWALISQESPREGIGKNYMEQNQ